MNEKEPIMIYADVSKCGYFRKDDPCKNTCQYFCTPCEWVDIQNCMYKYGKRKEEECEKLKAELKDMTIRKIDYLKESLLYKQTLAEIKEIAENDCKTYTVKLLGEDEINCKRCYKTKILQKCEEVLKNE